MKHLYEYNQFNLPEADKYTVVRWEQATQEDEWMTNAPSDTEEIEEPDFFNVWIEDENGETHQIHINYEMFVDFLQQEMPNIKTYLDKFTTIDDMITNLQDLGFDFGEVLQSWVDYNVTKDTLDVDTEMEIGEEEDMKCDCCDECSGKQGCQCDCEDCLYYDNYEQEEF